MRRGLYASVPLGVTADELVVNPFLVAGRAAEDAVVAYHSALEVHGVAYSVWHRFQFLSASGQPFSFRGSDFVPLRPPKAVADLERFGGHVEQVRLSGADVAVTSVERTMVDVLHSPRHGGGWEEIWRSLERVEYFDLQAVVDYVGLLKTTHTAAKVGFYLEQNRERLFVDDATLEALAEMSPRQTTYLERSKREPGQLVKPWNLVVPEWLLSPSWQE